MGSCKLLPVLLTCVVVAMSLNPGGWLDRVVQFYKTKFYNELEKLAPINIHAAIHEKPPGYVDSQEWDYESVIRLLTLIRTSENAKPVRTVLRRMLQPTRRIMMSMKESMHRFPSLMKDTNNFYYDVEYTDDEEEIPSPPLHEDQMVIAVSNPVEARLPSAKISVQLLRDILVARAQAAKQMPPTARSIIPWIPMNTTFAIIGHVGGGGNDSAAGGGNETGGGGGGDGGKEDGASGNGTGSDDTGTGGEATGGTGAAALETTVAAAA
ncbi:keratin, type II cytoskeletal 1b [Helicoverpa armigera]|uniref:keratin, type II cytoskeletal 1b n=1 Tax=Helicoverpa armigera TaxID=29058 RepID=UPI003083DFB4